MMPERTYFCRFTFGQFFTLLVLEIFTLGFVFYLGSRFGTDFLPTPQTSAMANVANPSAPLKPDVYATTQDPEIQALAKDLVQSAPTTDLKQRVSELLQRNAAQDFAPKASPISETPPAALPSAPATAETPAPEQNAPSLAVGHYAIQVGSYPTRGEAENQVQWWTAKGYEAYVTSADIPEKGRWYRVRMGGFASKSEAEGYLEQLQQKEQVDALVIFNQ